MLIVVYLYVNLGKIKKMYFISLKLLEFKFNYLFSVVFVVFRKFVQIEEVNLNIKYVFFLVVFNIGNCSKDSCF